MSYQEDLIMSIYNRGEPGLAMSKRGDMAKEWYDSWKKQNGLPADSNALPPVDSTPPWARPYLFPRAEASPNEGMMIADRTYTADDVLMPLESGAFLNREDVIYGHVLQNEGGYLKEGKMYDQGIHGLPIPLV